jgi:uncharacterized membrane protein YphA (DoxX/SURF4 family)
VPWSYFTGWTFIVAGVAILIGVYARLAAALSMFQMGIFLLLVWVPTIAAGSKDAGQWDETIVTVALTAAAWVVADSYAACGKGRADFASQGSRFNNALPRAKSSGTDT